MIFVRSNGAITVFAIEPAKAPQNRLITTVFTDALIEAVSMNKQKKKQLQSMNLCDFSNTYFDVHGLSILDALQWARFLLTYRCFKIVLLEFNR